MVDAVPTGSIELRWQAESLIACHDAQGRCVETLTEPSLAKLCSHIWSREEAQPCDMEGTKMAITRLLRAQGGRYVQHTLRDKGDAATHYSSRVLEAIQDCFLTTVHWLQGPLNALNNTSCPQMADCDTLTSFAYRWVGSGQAHPCCAPQQTSQALRWALASTLGVEAALTCMLLPDAPMAGFRRLLRHPNAHCICSLPSGTIPGSHPAAWTGRAPAPGPISHPMQMVIVANATGLRDFYADARVATLQSFMSSLGVPQISWPPLDALLQASTKSQPQQLALPDRFMAAADLTEPNSATVQATPASLRPLMSPQHPQLLMSAKEVIYTDGSKKGSSVTAACFRPDRDSQWAATCTGHPAHLNTALQGELAALHYAVHHMSGQDEDVVILTDSMTAIQLLRRMLERPSSLRYHMHRALLQQILPAMLARQGHTTICKVRAHIGVPGNSRADSLCRAAHAATAGDTFTSAADSTTGPNWVLSEHKTPEGATELRQVANLRRAAALRLHTDKLQDNPDKKYAELNKAVRSTNGGVIAKASNHFWDIPALSDDKKSLMMKVRQGLVVALTRKRHFDADSTEQVLCPLCPAKAVRDTQGHRLGGCTHPLIHGQVMARHGKTVHLLAQATREGHIGDCCIYSDAEGYDRYPDLTAHGQRCLPKWALPYKRQTSKPDLVVFPGVLQSHVDDKSANKKAYRQQHTIHLVEVGYTGDYGVHDRVAQKLTQHNDLQANLLNHGWKDVHMHAFVVGHTGMQPQSNLTVLQALQVDNADEVLKAVHMHSVHTCYSLLKSYEREARSLQDIATQHEDHTHHDRLPEAHRQVEQDGPPFGQRPTKRRCPSTASQLQSVSSHTQTMMESDSLQPPHPPMGPAPVQRPIIRTEWHPG